MQENLKYQVFCDGITVFILNAIFNGGIDFITLGWLHIIPHGFGLAKL